MLDIANRIITPAVIKYSKVVADEIIAKKAVNPDLSAETEKLLERLSDCLHEMGLKTHALHMLHEEAYDKETWPERAPPTSSSSPAMDNLRAVADRLEELTDRAYWPLPTYNDYAVLRLDALPIRLRYNFRMCVFGTCIAGAGGGMARLFGTDGVRGVAGEA